MIIVFFFFFRLVKGSECEIVASKANSLWQHAPTGGAISISVKRFIVTAVYPACNNRVCFLAAGLAFGG